MIIMIQSGFIWVFYVNMTYLCLKKYKKIEFSNRKKTSPCCIYKTSIWIVMRLRLTIGSIGIYTKYAWLRNTLCRYCKAILDRSMYIIHIYAHILNWYICCIYKSKKKEFFISNFCSFIQKVLKNLKVRRFFTAWSKCLADNAVT